VFASHRPFIGRNLLGSYDWRNINALASCWDPRFAMLYGGGTAII